MADEEKLVDAGNSSNALTVDTSSLNKESTDLVNQIIAEKDVEKTKDLTSLFNVNQVKKTLVRLNKLGDLQDIVVDQAIERFTKRPDEIDNATMIQTMKTVQEMIERGNKQVAGVQEQPTLIQINQTNTEVNVGTEHSNLTKESRDKINSVISAIMGNVQKPTTPVKEEDPIDIVEETTDEH